ncbi:sprouty-related, EVH1 domain-containing protein 2-like [Babylonia areolata]|uniref:sprouty-related, EVH1 domain-containing protein 2-like n=1 Tax=Babylonia areolata TaxID=304850 RepID=UPI003FD6499C
MTNYPSDNGDYLVEVQAQVMTRDHSTQCWVPMGGGGLSTVKLCKVTPGHHGSSAASTQQKAEYVIHGERLADKSVVLDCVLTKDIQYTKANPKFHHWNSDEKRFGLTFERSDDARAFDHGIRHAVAELNEGCEGEERIFQIVDLPLGRKNSSSQSASTTSTTTNSPSPHSPTHPSSLPLGCPDPFQFAHPNHHHHLHRVHYMPPYRPRNGTPTGRDCCQREEEQLGGGFLYGQKSSPVLRSESLESWSGIGGGEEVWVKYEDYSSGKSDTGLLDSGVDGGGGGDRGGSGYKDEPYVIFARSKTGGAPPLHEYSYPSLDPASGVHKPLAKRECTSAAARKQQPLVTQPHHLPHPPLPIKTAKTSGKVKGGGGEQSRRLVAQCAQCQHCRVMFNAEENQRGSCDSAPDTVTDCIEFVSCVYCTKPLFYHCCADADGQYSHPCECDSRDDSNCKKWTALTILSCFLPCLLCYLPLHACHRCGVACGVCGGRHKAA